MANRVSVEITANTTGYKNAIDEAKGANQQFQSSMEKIDIGKLNREMRTAQKSATGLALELYKLRKEGKVDTSEYRNLQRELIKSKKEAAELLDVVNDTREGIRNLASDTAAFDAFQEGVNVARDGMSAIAALTGSEEQFKSVLLEVARIQTVCNTAISIGNALQKQSKIMTGIRAIQEAALSHAIDAEAAATGRATVAQRLFNTVAKANPYVLLATGVLTLVGAIGTYIAIVGRSTEEEKRALALKEALAKAQEDYNSTFTQVASNTLTKYKQLQAEWKTLKSEHEKNAWIKKNKNEFENLELAVTDIKSAEETFYGNTSSVVEGLMQRAKGAAVAAQAQNIYAQALAKTNEMEALKAEYADKMAKVKPEKVWRPTYNGYGGGGSFETVSVEEQRSKLMTELTNKLVDMKLEQQDLIDQGDQMIQDSIKLLGVKTEINKETNKGNNKGKKLVDKDNIDYAKYSLTALEQALSKFESDYKGGLLPKVDKDSYIKQVEELKKEIQDKKIEIGVELPKTELEEIEEKVNKLKADQLRVETRLDSAQYQAELKRLENEKHELKVKIGLEVEPSAFEKISKTIEEKLNGHNIPIEFDPNMEPSKLDKMKRELEQYTYITEHIELSDEDRAKFVEKINQLKADIEQEEIHLGISTVENKVIKQKEEQKSGLQEKVNTIMNENGGIPEPNTDAYALMVKYLTQIRDLNDEITAMQDPLAAAEEKHNKLIQQRAQALQGIGGAVSTLGSALGSLAEKEDEGAQVAALIAQAIGSVLAGMGTAIAQAGTMGPWAWVAFTAAALATAATTISQINNLSSQAKGYATGGIVGGNSFYGDRIPIMVNSGESVVTTKQQRQFIDIANGKIRPKNNQGQFAISSVSVEGTELILAINNTLKENGQPTIG